ncbi:MAG: TIGR03032 family protein [Gemmataceae bacterium]
MDDSSAEGKGQDADLRSIHTTSFPALLDELGISLLVSTYQAGKLIAVSSRAGTLNTHFRNFTSPMGMAYQSGRLALGTKCHVWELHNQPEVAAKLEPQGRHDACFLPRALHVTGDIRIHEIAWAGPELWTVNTRFSCLCTLDRQHSFVPRWQPPFITELAPEDRCHLNGLGLRDGRPKYATCLGRANSPNGWRENKARGGCLLDVPSGEVIAAGLSMPHSPRWYRDRLWILESGTGALAIVDEATGRCDAVAQMPGFTRGLEFFGPYAFIGLSQVRETAAFSGIPITERSNERVSGVWVIDIRTGQTAAFLQFQAGVQEVFAVLVLPGLRSPEIVNEENEILANSFAIPA